MELLLFWRSEDRYGGVQAICKKVWKGNPTATTMKNVSRGLATLTVPFTMSFPKSDMRREMKRGGNETRMEVFLKVEGRSTLSPGLAPLSPKLLATTFAGCFTLLQQYNHH
ncbi:Mitochondrial inner membrane protein OXA1 [Prunus dulcis]|uniref:Mitochondrial inner membrane protein OXA1 n=1 Tax=Prunus dulcis TaxID=3755 RepID=A0A4Y1RJG9_PRUDU|nr:Mitochondrial inner membrane protein OXA1 [Prunus dulcis]